MINFLNFFNLFKVKNFILFNYFKWGLGIGDWGLGIGDWGLRPIPNPQSPIPNPQSPFSQLFQFILILFEFYQ